jgi:hypothetical protein
VTAAKGEDEDDGEKEKEATTEVRWFTE